MDQPIYVSSADEVVNYVNSKTTTTVGLSENRSKDLITDLSFMSHGVPAAIALGYENTNWTGNYADPTLITPRNIGNIVGAGFSITAKIDIYSCNSATPFNMKAVDFSSQTSLVEQATSGNNIVRSLSNQVKGATVTGFIGQTSYSGVGNGELPKPATMDGSYSPTVNGQHPSTIKVSMQNGKVKNP